MYKIEKPFDTVSHLVMLTVPTCNKIKKVDIVENLGVGMWFANTDLPSIILTTQTDEEAEYLMKGFEKANMKTKIKVLKNER